jgi:diguanylate cyclase (GGDEF)-like protein
MRHKLLKVLVVEDAADDLALIRRSLHKGRSSAMEVTEVASLEAALEHLDDEDVDLVFLDLEVTGAYGVETVRRIRRIAPTVPIVVVVSEKHETLAIQALQRDAQDYVLKHQLNPGTLGRAIRYATEADQWHVQYRRQLSISPDGVLIADLEGRVLFVNSNASAMLGHAPARLTELPAPLRSPTTRAFDVWLATGRVAEVREVSTFWSGRPARLITMRDITARRAVEQRLNATAEELKRANERLERLVSTDPLTQVLNRRGMEEALGFELRRAERTGDPMIAALIDCDDFKSVNDSFGHAVGDAALTALSRSIQETVRAGDYLGRVGGDEFLVLLPATTVAEGLAVAEKLRQAVKATTLPLATEGLSLSASVGVGPVPENVVTLEEVLAALGTALKRSKHAGKDAVSDSGPAPPEGERRSARRRGVVSKPQLDADSIALRTVVQGIRSVEDGTLIGYEALTRGPPGIFAMPTDLFRAAFEQNVLTTLDLRALRTSLRHFGEAAWDGWCHVNLFPSTLLNTPPERLIPLLGHESVPERLCIELSEQQFLGDPTYLRPSIRELRSAGFRVAIDDVGFGRSSIEALMLLEPDVVKVDRRCIQWITTEAGKRRQLERLLAMLRAVDAVVIVEGVERPDELAVLQDLGVAYGQGYLWGRPAPAAATVDTPVDVA